MDRRGSPRSTPPPAPMVSSIVRGDSSIQAIAAPAWSTDPQIYVCCIVRRPRLQAGIRLAQRRKLVNRVCKFFHFSDAGARGGFGTHWMHANTSRNRRTWSGAYSGGSQYRDTLPDALISSRAGNGRPSSRRLANRLRVEQRRGRNSIANPGRRSEGLSRTRGSRAIALCN